MISLNHRNPNKNNREYISPTSLLAYLPTYLPTYTPQPTIFDCIFTCYLGSARMVVFFFFRLRFFLFLGIFLFCSAMFNISVHIYIFPVLLGYVGVTSLFGFLLRIPFIFPSKYWLRSEKNDDTFLGAFFFLSFFLSFFPWFGSRGSGYWLARFAGCASDRVGMVGCPDSGGERLCDQKSWGCLLSFSNSPLSGAVGAVVVQLLSGSSPPRACHVCDVMNVCMYVYVFCDFFLFSIFIISLLFFFLSGSVHFFCYPF